MGDYSCSNLFYEIKISLSEVTDQGLEEIIRHWDTTYGTSSNAVVKELASEFIKTFKEFWKEQSAKLEEIERDYLKKIGDAGEEAVLLEKALGLEPQVSKVSVDGPLVQMEEQLSSLIEKYQELKKKRLDEYFSLRNKEKELCSVLEKETDTYKLAVPCDENDGSYIPTSADINLLKERIDHWEELKDQLEYDFEEAKGQLRQLLEECGITPVSKGERFAVNQTELETNKRNLSILKDLVLKYRAKKEEMMAEAGHLRDQIERLSNKMFKDVEELEEFLSVHSRFTESTITKLKKKLEELNEERKQNLKNLIPASREVLTEWWNKCCYSKEQRDEFAPFKATRLTEEVLEFHELEIERLEYFYNSNKKIFTLAENHEELWERLLHLEEQANNKDRLFNNRGGCLLKEEKERKVIQKRLPSIKSKLMMLLDAYKEETKCDFLYFGEPLQQKIEIKEHLREMSKHQERIQRKAVNSENMTCVRPATGTKRKAAMTPQDITRRKAMRTETLSSTSSASSENIGTLVQREKDRVHGQSHMAAPVAYATLHTPGRKRIPAASTPQNGTH